MLLLPVCSLVQNSFALFTSCSIFIFIIYVNIVVGTVYSLGDVVEILE